MHAPILPAIIPTSAAHLNEMLARVPFAPMVQIDVVDGVFASPATWPYKPSGSLADVASVLQGIQAEVDLMAYRPIESAYDWYRVGVRQFVFHIETLDAPEMLAGFKEACGTTIGCALSSDTPLSMLEPYMNTLDFIQLMGIARIGVQGEPFDERVLARIKTLKSAHPNVTIAIDGSVNSETLPRLHAAGADRFAVGSAILSAANPEAAYRSLIELLP